MVVAEVPLDYRNRIEALLDQIRRNYNRSFSLFALWEATNNEAHRHYFVHPSLRFFETIQTVLSEGADQTDLENITGCLWYLSRDHGIREILVSPDHELVPILMNVLHSLTSNSNSHLINQNNERIKEHILKFFSNCSLQSTTLPYLLREEYGYLQYHKTDIIHFSQSSFSYQSLFNIISGVNNERLSFILEKYPFTVIIYEKLCGYGIRPQSWFERFRGICYWGLNTLMAISSLPSGANHLKQVFHYQSFIPLLAGKNQLIEGVKAFFILCNVYSDSEEDENTLINYPNFYHITTNLLLQLPTLLTFTQACLIAIIEYKENTISIIDIIRRGYAYSIIKLRDVTSALAHMAIPKMNKGLILDDPTIIETVLRVLDDYNNQKPEYSAKGQLAPVVFGGGGPDDYESIENILEFLIQLSFHYEYLEEEREDVHKSQTVSNIFDEEFSLFGSYHIPTLLNQLLQLPSRHSESIVTDRMMLLAKVLLENYTTPDLTPSSSSLTANTTIHTLSVPNNTYGAGNFLFPTQTFSASMGGGVAPSLRQQRVGCRSLYHRAWNVLHQRENVKDGNARDNLLRTFNVSNVLKFRSLSQDQYAALAKTLHPTAKSEFITALGSFRFDEILNLIDPDSDGADY